LCPALTERKLAYREGPPVLSLPPDNRIPGAASDPAKWGTLKGRGPETAVEKFFPNPIKGISASLLQAR
jgi:hypothetical protein